jgi:hypothetical protein
MPDIEANGNRIKGIKQARTKTKLAVLKRREDVSELLSKGYSVYSIAEKLGLRNEGVYKIIRRMRECYQKKIELYHDSYIQRINLGYNKVLSECWDAWERSKCDHKGEARQPNVLYLDRILAAMEALRKLHGLDKVVPKQDDSGKTGQALDWDSLTARKSLSSVTVNINGNHVSPNRNDDNDRTSLSVVSDNLPSSQVVKEFKDAVDDRIEELHRRAQAKQVEVSPSSQEVPSALQDDKGQVTQPLPKVVKLKRVVSLKRTILVQANSFPLGDE